MEPAETETTEENKVTTRRERKFLGALDRLRGINNILGRDAISGLERFRALISSNAYSGMDLWSATFPVKAAVRALFAQMEGVSHVMRLLVMELADDLRLDLPEDTRLLLAGKQKKPNGKIVERRLRTDQSLELAFTHFAALFDAPYTYRPPPEEDFRILKDTRNAFTHPRTLGNLIPANAVSRIQPIVVWFGQQSIEIIAACASAVTGEVDTWDEGLVEVREMLAAQKPITHPPLFDEGEEAEIRKHPIRSLRHLQEGLIGLKRETNRGLDLWTQESHQPSADRAPQFGLRIAVQTIDSDVQGTVNLLTDFILASEERGGFKLSDEEKQLIARNQSWTNRLVGSLNLFSSRYGAGARVRTEGEEWESWQKFRRLRDRLVHPKHPRDLNLGPAEELIVVNSALWFMETLAVVQIDAERWAKEAARAPGVDQEARDASVIADTEPASLTEEGSRSEGV